MSKIGTRRKGKVPIGFLAVALLSVSFIATAQAATEPGPVLNTECPATEKTIIISSDAETMVTAGNAGVAVPYPAVAAWEPFADTDPSFWEINIDYDFVEADWIWESYRVVNPVDGDIVEFEREFSIPGYPVAGSLAVTVDNGYEANLNGGLIGTRNLSGDWRAGNLRQPWVDGNPAGETWTSVEVFDVTSALVPGDNLLAITGVNEFMDPTDEFNVDVGNPSNNPAGLIYELTATYQSNPACVQ